MENEKFVSSVKRFSSGIYLFKTWTLQAFDKSGKLICEIYEKEPDNYTKYVKFLRKIKECGYTIPDDKIKELRSEPFISSSFFTYVSANDIFRVSEICGYSKDYVLSIDSKSQEEKEKYGYDLGFLPNEIDEVIQTFKGKLN